DHMRSESGRVECGRLELAARAGWQIEQEERAGGVAGRRRAEEGGGGVGGAISRRRRRENRRYLSEITQARRHWIDGYRLDRTALSHPGEPPRRGQSLLPALGRDHQGAAQGRAERQIG